MNRLTLVVFLVWAAFAGVLTANAQPITTIYSFTEGPATPLAGLTLGPDGNFYGTADAGGSGDRGIAFKITTNGSMTTLVDFDDFVSGEYPQANLILGSDGNFYGTTSQGGTNMNGNNATGTVFKMTTNGTVTTLVNFNGLNGGIPLAGLALAPDGYYYGTTEYGGTNGDGTVFKMTTNGTLTTLVSFNGTNGLNPIAGLAVGPGGNLYGTTRNGGGTNGYGTVFTVTTNGTFYTLFQFGGTNGALPYGGVTVGPDGNLYGTTAFGGGLNGDFSSGSVFELTTNGVITTLVSFADFGGTNGSNPYAGLTLGPDGNFYGTTYAGGAHGNGTVFQVSTNGTLAMLARIPGITVEVIFNSQGYEYYTTNGFNTIARVYNGTLTSLYSFSAQTNFINADGAQPQATVAFGPDGLVYGTAASGGTNGYGTVFKVTTNGAFSTLASFSGNNGDSPMNALTVGPNGNFYGTANTGGTGGYGTVFKLTPGGAVTTLVNFDRAVDGANPQAGLTLGPGGNFYGTAVGGGSNLVYTGNNTYNAVSDGTAFQLTTNGIFTTLVAFSGTNGANPYGGLAVGLDGNLYGTTAYGGISNDGTIFLLKTNGTLTTLTNFIGANGASPFASMTLGLDGNFYGTCMNGGTNNDGTVFQVQTNGTLTTLVYFNGTNGANPNDGLLLGPDGNFYGTAFSGGAGNHGTVFKVTPGGTLTTLVSFAQTNGDFPVGGLALGPDGYFYGTTETGGVLSNAGTVFKLSTNGTLTTLYDFVYSAKSPNGNYPFATLTLATNGNFIHFYGSTYNGGSGGGGTVFQLNQITACSMAENSTNTFSPLTNDVLWITGGTLNLLSVTASNGTAQFSGPAITFTPAVNFTGTATIDYTVTNTAGGTNHALITVLVTNIPPVANPDFYTVAENSSANVLSPLTNDVVGTTGGMLSLVSVSPTNGTASISGTNVLFTPQANFVGTATIGYTITDNVGGTNSSLITVTVVNLSADLSVSAGAAPEPVGVGSNLVYSIAVSNAGPSTATGVMVSNQIPADVTFVSATGGATPSGGVLLLNLGSLAEGATGSAQIIVQPTLVGALSTEFQVFANETDPVPANNIATVVSTVTNIVLYNVFDLGGLGSNTFATAVNNLGQIVGFSQSGAGGSSDLPVYWTNYLHSVFSLSQTGTTYRANSINNSGQIVGGEVNQVGFASFWTNGGSPVFFLDSQSAPRSRAAGINSSGQIAGGYSPVGPVGELPAFWTNSGGQLVALNYLGGANAGGTASAINDSGQMVGESGVTVTGRHATFWTNSSSLALDLGTLGGTKSSALSINAADQIVGDAFDSASRFHAVYWTNSASPPVALGLLDGVTNIATSINNLGQIVGAAGSSGNPFGVAAAIWTDHTSPAQNLNNLIPTNSGWTLLAAGCINDLGEIVGFGIITNEGVLQARAFALIPINQPTNADLNLSASAAPNPVATGSNLVYSLSVSNAGPAAATGVVVSNQIPADVTFVSATGGATPSAGVLVVDLGSLAPGTTSSIQIVVQPSVTGTLTNVFQVSASQNDPVPANNVAKVVSTVTNATVLLGPAVPGTPIAWTDPGGALVITYTFGFGGNPVPIQAGSGSSNPASTGQAGDLVLLFTTNGVTAPTNWAAVVRFFNPADPTGSNGLAATFSQAFFATNFGGSGFNGYKLFPVTSYIPEGLITTNANGVTIFDTTYTQFGPVGGIGAGQEDVDLVSVFTLTSGVNITSPTNGQVVNNAALTVTGTATNYVNSAVTNVFFQLNGGVWTNATTVNGWTNWSANVTLAPGSNTVQAYAVDGYGSFSPTNSVTFDYVTTAPNSADLSLGGTNNATASYTSNMVYSLSVTNLGPSTATGVVVSNQIPPGALFISATGGATPVNGVLLVNLGSLAPGAVTNFTITMNPSNNPVGFLTNVFQVSANEPDPVPANNSAAFIIQIVLPTTEFSTSSAEYDSNTITTVSQQVTNYSTELIAKLPNGTVVYDQTFTAAYADPTVQTAITTAAGDLAGAGAPSYTGPVQTLFSQTTSNSSITVPTSTNITLITGTKQWVGPVTFALGNFGVVTGYTFDPVATNYAIVTGGNRHTLTLPSGDTDFDTMILSIFDFFSTTTLTTNYLDSSVYVMTGIVAQADVSITASASPEPVGVGSNLIYSLTVSNALPVVAGVVSHASVPPATDVTISNRIPVGATFVSTSDGAAPTNGLLLINLGSLGVGQTNGVQIVVQPTVAGKLTNVFMVYADQTDPVPNNNVVTVVSTVTNPPPPTVDVAVSIIAAPNPVDVGSALTYSLTASNNSPTSATGVVVSNALPPNVIFESALPSQGSATNKGSLVTYNIGTLPNGAAATIAIVVIPNAAGLLTNKATIYSAQTDSNPANNSATNITTAVSVPITNLVVTVLSGITLNKQTGLYEQQIEVSNGGPNTPASVLLLVNGLTGGATLYNATGKTNGVPYVQSTGPLGVGSNIVFLLEYYSPTRTMPTHLTFTVEPGPPVNPPVITGTVMSISRTVALGNGKILVEFAAIPGRLYAIQYSSDMVAWQTALPVITAPANRVQWIDAGPPQTASSPATAPARYYRVVLLP